MTTFSGIDPSVLRDAMLHVRSQTGVDLMDRGKDQEAAAAAMKQAFRQVVGAVVGGMLGAAALISLILAVVPGDAGIGVRVTFLVLGLVFATAAVAFARRMMRPTPGYLDAFVSRQAAWRRLCSDLGLPDPYHGRKFTGDIPVVRR